jgi:hypothetical protein
MEEGRRIGVMSVEDAMHDWRAKVAAENAAYAQCERMGIKRQHPEPTFGAKLSGLGDADLGPGSAPEITKAIEAIHARLEALFEHAEELGARLRPVIAEIKRENSVESVAPMGASKTQMGDRLNEFAYRLGTIDGILVRLLGTLEI